MQQVDQWFETDIQRSLLIAKNALPTFGTLEDVRQQVMVSLAFNLGNRLEGFPKFLAAMQAEDYSQAAAELRNSAWYGQVGRRGAETCATLLQGFYGFL